MFHTKQIFELIAYNINVPNATELYILPEEERTIKFSFEAIVALTNDDLIVEIHNNYFY